MEQEQELNINVFELLGAKLGLLSSFKDNTDIKHIRVMMDDNKAVVSVNIMGGIKSDLCGNIAFGIWRCIAEQKI